MGNSRGVIPRRLEAACRAAARKYPIVTVTGPRQSGKSTLCRRVFPKKPFVSLEPLDTREAVRADPRGFLRLHQKSGAVVDEVQHVPELFSYLQHAVDEDPRAGRFVLTGSQNFALTQGVSQSLAGRTALLELLPPSLGELRQFKGFKASLWWLLWRGSYPRIYDRKIPPHQWLGDYVATYVERDVRQVLKVGDLKTFSSFLRLCAGRTAQEVNLAKLGSDAGVTHNTARAWLSVLEASYLCFMLPAWHVSVRKQLIKAPKLHFFDSGLLCYLLGIQTPEQLRLHPLRGAIFESWVASELYKASVHQGVRPRFFHLRDANGLEIDLVVEQGSRVHFVEAKSGETFVQESVRPMRNLAAKITDKRVASWLVYGGDQTVPCKDARVVPWNELDEVGDGFGRVR